MVIFSLFLLLFSALAISVLYIGQSAQNGQNGTQSWFDINEVIKAELSGNSLIVDEAAMKDSPNSGEAVVLPKGN